ncbi:MAG TPA: nucleosidase [Alphaproteobacteria bacterium]|nr:nucleosidase [Alphaproteobacteria bacterium]USO05579.1 MAG: nucleosidase [Rhodospirillales bacterium]HOO82154.1 nucleosidase [Alphaproteobacteria bacterium]
MKPLLVFAMKEESQDVFVDYDVLHCQIGKINASHNLMRQIAQNRPELVVNLGTAGSRKHAGGTIVNPTQFIQRDMDVTALGIELYQTPFSDDPIIIEHGLRFEHLPGGICGTGDNFDASQAAATFDVVDMEAYALALICKRENIPFACLKYVSDGANDDAHMDWHEALHITAEKLHKALKGANL